MAGPVRSVSLSFALMRLLAAAKAPQSLTELSRATGTSPSSCLNLLRTLLAEKVIETDGAKRYKLANGWLGLVQLSENADEQMIARAQPLMQRLAQDQQTTVGLWRVGTQERLQLIAIGESKAATRIQMMIGQRQPFGGGATGRALAALCGADETELARRFAVLRWQRALDFPTYAAQVAAAKSVGYALDDGFGHAGVCSVAAFIPAPEPAYCLSATVFQGSRDNAGLAQLGEALRSIAAAIVV